MGGGSPDRAADRVRGVPGITWELDMGFSPAEVVAGVADLLVARGVDAAPERHGTDDVFRIGEVVITIGPLPAARATHALFHPRTLVVVDGEGPVAESIKADIPVRLLRVMG